MSRPTHISIDTAALRANLERVKSCTPKQHVMAVIKANGYGHGAIRVANILESEVDAFAVCCLEEALHLREAGITQQIVLLEGFFHFDELSVIANQDLQVVIHTSTQLEHLIKTQKTQKTQLKKPINVWLKVDTGMHRLGFAPNEIEPFYKFLKQCPQVATIRLMSHLSCADNRQDTTTEQQARIFTALARHLNLEASLANSAGILGWPQTYADWVRPGIMLYGVSPFTESVAKEEGLKPVMQLQSALISVKRHRKGETIGYGATWRCPQSMPVGVIAGGYADGYPRHAPSGTPVLVNGKRVPLVGRVSMDMISVDLRSQPNARIGDPVVLWGRRLPIEEIATLAGTIAYELLCNVSNRVKIS
ncbi:alanine racemase [Candidatus Parabeggiatoa sp. HSG14]|uniref:alanine racemase n=1 Tax=Candidatus Parabeggiatoa sp. HSG14 TaxID=3055593 RepID=UPI0025A6AFFC|nr:alanine racemase [Thiotrichales bacterium HSG14]